MRTLLHPTFQKTFQQHMLITWTGSVASFGLGLWLLKQEIAIGALFAAVFVIIAVVGMGLMYYRLHHVVCLECGGSTRTCKDPATRSKWVAVCQPCQITWDLQTGVADS